MSLHKVLKYLIALALITFIAFALFWGTDFLTRLFIPAPKPSYGVTFSVSYTKYLGLDLQTTYQAILDDLGSRKVRMPVYWDTIEKEDGKFDFSEYDNLLKTSKERGAQVILAIGYKVPRWPECSTPPWANSLDNNLLQQKVLRMVKETVTHYKNDPEIVAWQVENEPLLDFGICRMLGEPFLKEEVGSVRSLDSRPIILTDSGELGTWVTALQNSNIMGTSLYRIVWNPFFGYFRYPFPPLYYDLKAQLTRLIFAGSSRGVFVSELQAEPWTPGKSVLDMPIPEQMKLFTLDNFKEVVDFTKWTRLSDQYFWGVEWWYYMKLHGHPEYWEYAKGLFKPQF